ncbi:MAG: RluA family pseudouridine synthase [Rhodospirillales bacterium]|nr:RluA family pseudouridine synthase [Rhodospirillales bacterium]
MTSETKFSVTVEEESDRVRLDKFLALKLPELSRTRVKALILEGQVACDGATINDPSSRVKSGQQIEVEIPEERPADPEPQDIPLTVVYEDEHLIVIDKPVGMVVHPAPGTPDGTLVNALLFHCADSLSGIGGVKRPGIVHRIDKDTSGLVVVAKNDIAHRGLAEQFADHSLTRAYRAIVWGVPSPREGEIEGNIGRSPHNRKKMAIVTRGGKHALTHYEVLKVLGTRASLVECRLETGRTHQIRVHMSSIGNGLIGDPVYGRVQSRYLKGADEELKSHIRSLTGQALHAFLIGFSHPVNKEYMEFVSENTKEFNELSQKLQSI